MRYAIPIVALALSTLASGMQAQDDADPGWKPELRPFIGASIPTGAHRHAIRSDLLFGLQVAAELRPRFHVVGSLAWNPARTRHATVNDEVQVLQYDAGVEFSRVDDLARGWQLRPFVGLGAGARSYLYAAGALNDRTCAVGYGAIGTELQIGETALRGEARDNVFCYESPLDGVRSRTRNDVGLSLGLSYHFR